MSNLKIFHESITKDFKKAGIDSKFTIVKDSKIKNPSLISSFCVFRMPDPYKDESMYINGLNTILDNFDKVMPKAVARIYYDDSVTKKDNKWKFLLDKAKTKDFVQLVHYEFKQFKKPNSFYHEGVFGMIVRYFVLFDFGNISETVMLDDIDYPTKKDMEDFYAMVKKGLKLMKNKATYIFGTYGYRAYLTKPRLMVSDITKKYDFNIRMVTQPSICTKKINRAVLIDMMICVLEKCKDYQKWMSETIDNMNCVHIPEGNQKRIQQCNYIKEIEQLPNGVFMFGTDEFFLNSSILEFYLKDKKPFIVYYEMPSMTHFHYALFIMFKQRRIPLQFMLSMYRELLKDELSGKELNSVNDIYKSFEKIDKQIYTLSVEHKGVIQTPETKRIFKRIYDFLKPRVNQLLSLPKLEVFEKQMFAYLKNTKEEDFVIGKHFYKVEYQPNKHYKLIRLD